jgi:hypothetical protein
MFQSILTAPACNFGVIVQVGYENAYKVKFYYPKQKQWGNALALTKSEVEWVGHLPEGTELDW